MKRLYVAIIAACLLFGCASTSVFHKYRTVDAITQSPASVAMDAEQRAIIAVPVSYEQHIQREGEQVTLQRKVILCAEPSPDVASELQQGVGLSANIDSDKQLSFAQLLLEQATEIGERNATIQLLRDGLYRQCEAFLNGAITYDQYKDISNRYVDAMVTLLAIERLTASAGNRASAQNGHEFELESSVEDGTITVGDGNEDINNAVNSSPGTSSREYDSNLGASVSRISETFLNKNIVDKCLNYIKESEQGAATIRDSLLRRLEDFVTREESITNQLDSVKKQTEEITMNVNAISSYRNDMGRLLDGIDTETGELEGLAGVLMEAVASVETAHGAAVEELSDLISEIESEEESEEQVNEDLIGFAELRSKIKKVPIICLRWET